MSRKLREIGVVYSPSAVRKAARRGAPMKTPLAFAGWLGIQGKADTAATTAAARAAGLVRGDSTLGVAGPNEGIAALAELFRREAVTFWLTANPIAWMTLTAAAGPRPEGEPPPSDFADPDFLPAVIDALYALARVAKHAPAVSAKFEAAGIVPDVAPWIAVANSPGGSDRLLDLARRAHAEFADLPES